MLNNIILCLLSAVLFSLPWHGAPGYLLFGAFVPLLMLQQKLAGETGPKGKPRRIFWYIAGTFLAWNIASIYWLVNAAWIAVIAAVLISTLMAVAPFMIYHYIWKRAKRPLAYTMFAALWLTFEFAFTHGEINFPWLVLGNGFANTVEAVQWYEYTGVFGGSLWVLIVNLLLYEGIKTFRGSRQSKEFILPVIVAVIPIVVSVYIYKMYEEAQRPIKIEVIQPNIDPYREKFGHMSQQEQTDIMLSLARKSPEDVDFIVTPETSIDNSIWEHSMDSNPAVRVFGDFLSEHRPGATFITGATTFRKYQDEASAPATARKAYYEGSLGLIFDAYNSALLIDTAGVADIYHKSMLVIGVEKMPYHEKMKFLERLSLDLGGMAGQLGFDKERSVFTSRDGVKIGVPICYESVFGEYCSGYVDKGAQALFIITNDGWWGNTAGHRQHLSFARLRAIELRRSIARSANTGISGFINQRGDIVSRIGWDERDALYGVVNLNNKITFYARFGDMAGRLACYLSALGILYFIAYRRRKKDHMVS